ncbi:PREDICTED: AF4/FMR2 family member 1 isoform X2 [Myotis brandtii]|uniref:AF4/FMR2 family member 1 isoform X2 n=1 Tax=Myotis brandtii TaxID=109478 RepID=UPI0003BBDB37|nr:PREDICTED: AF4/FMR2 family member 1 isoform X2 [Myotis brandtii]
MAFTERVHSSSNSLYNEDRNLLRIREKERRNQEAHQEKEAFSEKIPLFGEPYKTEKGDELSSRIQNMLGNYEEVKELLSTKSLAHHLDASESRPGKPRYPLFPEKGSGVPPHSFHTRVHHQPGSTPASGPLPVGNMSHNQKVTQPRMEPMPSLHVKSYGAPDSQHLAQDRLGQEGYSSSHRKNGDRRAEGDHCASTADSAPERELSPLLSSLPSPLPPLSPLHSNQQTLPRSQGSSKVHSSNNNNNNKGYCHAKSPKDLAVKIRDKETPKDSLVAVSSLGVAPPQPPSQSFPPPSLPSKSVAMQQKPTAYVRPMDGQDQAPSESPELKPLPEDYRQQTFEKTDLKVPAKAKLTKLKMPSQSVETYSNEVHCVEEILKEMTHSWPPPLTAIHTPSTAEPSKFPFPTKDSQHISSATQNQKQYDTSSKTRPHSQQGTSMLEDDLQLSDSEDSENEQAPEKPPSTSAPPSAPQSLPEAAASAHSSGAESESTSDSDSSSDSESESSSSDSEENEPQDTPAPEPEPPTTNKWQLDNWLTKVSQPAAPPEALGSAAPPLRHPDGKGKGGDGTTSHEHSESKDPPPPKSSGRAPRIPPEGSHTGKRSCQKSPAQQEPPQRQTVGTKQPKKPVKASAPADSRASLQVESEPGLPHSSKDQPPKDKPKVKTKGRPRAGDREPKPAVPTPSEKKKHRGGPPAPTKARSGPEPTKDNVEDRSPEHLALVPLTHGQGPKHDSSSGGRTSGCRRAVVVQEDPGKDKLQVPLRDTKLLSPLRDTPPLQSLVVKITLDLLSWVPQPPGKGSRQKKPEDKQPPAGKKLDSEKRSSDNSSKLAKKRKGEAERDHDSKKVRLEKEVKSQSSSSSHKEASKTKTPRPSEPSKKEMLPPTLVSSSSSSSQKPAKPTQKRPRREAHPCSQDPPKSASSTKGNHKDSPAPKRRKAEGKGSGSSTEQKGSSGDTANSFPVPSLPNGNSKPGKPPSKLDKQADLHMKEAKKLKQKAELMTDKVGKAFKYLEAVLSFIECGIAMESESPVSKSASKSAFAVYSETEDLVKVIMSLKSFSDPAAPTQEKIFAVLCMRCQSILNMAMFRCKKERAIKYSRALNDHFQSPSKVTQAPSPCIARSTGAPSPLSPMPSASSVGSQASAGSVGGSGIPANIQNMTSSYITITSHIFAAVDLWEQAEVLTRKNKEFFAQLSTSVCTLALNSSLADLVHYTRQGFQWLKQGSRAP